MESNNGIGNMELSEREVSEVYESIDLEKYCDENMTGLERFYEQEPRIENKDCKEKTSEGKDKIIIGLFRKNFEQNLTKSDEDLVNNLVDLGQKNIVLHIDINEGLNVFDVGDEFPKDVPPEIDQNKTAGFNDFPVSEKNSEAKGSITEDGLLKGYFCSKTVFNLINEVTVSEKGLDFAPIQKTLNKLELRNNFEEFSCRMRCKWNFRNEPTNIFNETPAFRPKSRWKPLKGHASLEVFLSRVEKEFSLMK